MARPTIEEIITDDNEVVATIVRQRGRFVVFDDRDAVGTFNTLYAARNCASLAVHRHSRRKLRAAGATAALLRGYH